MFYMMPSKISFTVTARINHLNGKIDIVKWLIAEANNRWSSFLKQLPHLEHYGTIDLFYLPLILALPIFVKSLFKKRFPVYSGLVSLIFIILMPRRFEFPLNLSLCLRSLRKSWLCIPHKIYRQKADNKWIFLSLHSFSFTCLGPWSFVIVEPAIKNGHQSLFDF